jgi:hypothetical protein
MYDEWGRRGIHIEYEWESQKGKKTLGRPTCGWVDNILKWTSERKNGVV